MPSNKRFLGGLIGANPLRPKTEATAGDSDWNDVVLLLDGSGGSSTITDESSIGNTVTNSASSGVSNLNTTGPYGVTQDVLDFAGGSTDEGLSFPITTTMQLTSGSSDFTIETWIKRDSIARQSVISYWGVNTDARFNLEFDRTSGSVTFTYDTGPSSNYNRNFSYSGTSAAGTTNWFHLAVTASGNDLKCFIDGTQIGSTAYIHSATYVGGSSESYLARIGSLVAGGLNSFEGQMADFRITKGTARDIATDWTNGVYNSAMPKGLTIPPERFQDPGNVDRVTANVGVLSIDTAGPEDATLTEYTLADYTAYSETQITASNNNTSDRFGCGCDISGDGTITVFGAPFEDGATNTISDSGAVYVYENGTGVAILRAASPAANDNLGFDVAISKDGSTIVASAWQGDSSDGEIYVFEKPANGWADGTSSIILTHTPDQSSENLGITLAISDNGDTVVAGTRYGSTTSYSAEAFVFERPSGSWSSMTTETAKLSAASGVYSDKYSYGLAISGDGSVIAVGAPENNGGQTESGTVYLYDKPSGGWVDATETHLLSAPSRVAYEHFGQSCSLNEDGTLLVVGADGHSTNRGRVHVFEDSSGTWSHKALLTSTDTSSNQHIGMAVAVSRAGTTVAASAPGYNSDEGAIYVWMKPSAGWANGTNDSLLTAANGSAANNDELGGPAFGTLSPPSKLALDTLGGKVVTSSVNDDDTNTDSGSGFIFAATTTVPSSVSTTTKGSQWFWGGMRGRNAVPYSLVATGVISLSEHYQGLGSFLTSTFDALLVGGGGGGGCMLYSSYRDGGAGGGAEVATQTSQTFSGSSYTITIGEAGAGQTSVSSGNPAAADGGQTTFNGTTVKGGGGGIGHGTSSPWAWAKLYNPAVQGGGGGASSINNSSTSGFTHSGNWHTNNSAATSLPGNHGGGASGPVVNFGDSPTAPGPGVSSSITGTSVEYGIGGWGGYGAGYPDHTAFGCGGRSPGTASSSGLDGLPGAVILRVYGYIPTQSEIEGMITSGASTVSVSVASDGSDGVVTFTPSTTTTAASFTFTPS